jgi:hypothetical protein
MVFGVEWHSFVQWNKGQSVDTGQVASRLQVRVVKAGTEPPNPDSWAAWRRQQGYEPLANMTYLDTILCNPKYLNYYYLQDHMQVLRKSNYKEKVWNVR